MAGASGTAVQSTAEENSAAAGTGTVDASVSKIILIFLKIHQISQYERWFGLRAGDAAGVKLAEWSMRAKKELMGQSH